MSKLAVVYWTGTGNTETMANAVVEGAKVIATVKSHGKADKKINFKYNKKTYYRKKAIESENQNKTEI